MIDPILFEIVAWIAVVAAVGSAAGVLLLLAALWLLSRLSESISTWIDDEGGGP